MHLPTITGCRACPEAQSSKTSVPAGSFSHEVAIDASTAQPVFVREKLGSAGAGGGEQILSLATLPAGSVHLPSGPAPKDPLVTDVTSSRSPT